MQRDRRPPSPLDTASLERLALRYVERFATTRGKLAAYLTRKIRERGWDGPPPDPAGLAQRFADLGYVNDRLFAETRASAMTRRGLGARRVNEALRHAGIAAADADAVAPQLAARRGETGIAFARRRRFGPFAAAPADRALQAKQAAAMVRAGHAPDLAWRIVRLAPGEATDDLIERGEMAWDGGDWADPFPEGDG